MTGIVLALAGLSCGDGGPGAVPALEPVKVVVEFRKGFRARIRLPGGRPCAVEINDSGYLAFRAYYVVVIPGLILSANGEGRFRITSRFDHYRGTVSADSQGVLLSLNPVPVWQEFSDSSLVDTLRGLTEPRPREP